VHRPILIALVGLLAIGVAGNARSATLNFTGTLEFRLSSMPSVVAVGSGTAQLTDDGGFHLLSFLLPGGAFGPITTSLPLTSNATINSVVFTAVQNLSGSFTAISGGPPGGGPMGLQGVAKICSLGFGPCSVSNVTVPLTPTTGGAGFGLGGTQNIPGAVALTLQHAPWTIGQPTMTIHTPNSTITAPFIPLPGGFAHGPASLTSSTAQPWGVVQLVAVSKVYTSLTGAFPEMPVTGILTLQFVPEPGTLLLLASGVAVVAIYGRRKQGR
jgi:hypothetical protein